MSMSAPPPPPELGLKSWDLAQTVASAVLAILLVALGTHARRSRHPALRLFLWGASVAFVPLASSAISALLQERELERELNERDCKESAVCPKFPEGKASREVQSMWTLLLWAVIILVIKGNADTVVSSASTASGDVGVDDQKVRIPVERLVEYAWLAYLIAICMREADWLDSRYPGKSIFVVFFLLGFAKVVLRLVALFVASGSYAVGKNARLVSGYMAQLVEEGAVEGHRHVPPYVVMGESKDHVEETPQGCRVKRDALDDELGALVTLDRVWWLSDHGDGLLGKRRELRDLCLSFSLFKILRRHLSGYPLAEEGSSDALDFVLRGMDTAGQGGADADRVFRVLTDELWFASDFYYSPLALCSFSAWCAALNYLLSVLIIVGAIVVGWVYQDSRVIVISPDPEKPPSNLHVTPEQRAYYIITLFLLLATILTETSEILAGVCSNWTKMALLGSYFRRRSPGRWTHAALDAILSLRLRPAMRWTHKIRQNSVLEPRRFGRRSGFFSEKLYGRAGLMRSVKVSRAVKDALLRSLKSSYGGLDRGSTAAAPRVGLTGRAESWAWPPSGFDGNKSRTTEHILACHIGTSLFEIKCSHAACPTSAAVDMTAASHLSYYCAYLVAVAPGLLPGSAAWTEKRYKEVVEDVQAAFGDVQVALGEDVDGASASESTAQRYELLLKELSASSRDKVLRRGAELGRLLVETYVEDEPAAWRFLADFWSEMVLFVAPSKNVKGHVEAMGRGGELITLVWALLVHAGITDKADKPDGTNIP